MNDIYLATHFLHYLSHLLILLKWKKDMNDTNFKQ